MFLRIGNNSHIKKGPAGEWGWVGWGVLVLVKLKADSQKLPKITLFYLCFLTFCNGANRSKP